MLCGVKKSDNQKVFASQSLKSEGPFTCPGCHGELNIRKGNIKVHHFAHKPPYNCKRGAGESEAHRKCKETVYNELLKLDSVSELEVEKDFSAVISDVYVVINGVPVAIEIQRSNLSVNEIMARTAAYNELGIHVLWLALFSDELSADKYSPKAWEKWCHATYFGRVYYWLADLTIIPIHYSEYKIYVEPSNWYDEYGSEQSAGDYYISSKRYKTPSIGNYINIATDFKPITKQSWQGGSVYVPESKVYIDKLKKWW